MSKEKIIQYRGNNELIWRHPADRVDADTRIYVPATHVCVYLKEGMMLDSLMPGKHQVVEKKGIFHRKDSFISSFVYVNTQQILNLNWGTRHPIEIFDPMLNIPCEIKANGRYQISIKNPREFFLKVGGLDARITKVDLENYMSTIVMSNIKEAISRAMVVERVSFYDIWTNMSRLSGNIKNFLGRKFLEYGVQLHDFSVEDIFIPDDVRALVKKIHMEKYDLSQKGFTHRELYQDAREDQHENKEIVRDILLNSNEPSYTPDYPEERIICPVCGTSNEEGSRFCKSCGNRLN